MLSALYSSDGVLTLHVAHGHLTSKQLIFIKMYMFICSLVEMAAQVCAAQEGGHGAVLPAVGGQHDFLLRH